MQFKSTIAKIIVSILSGIAVSYVIIEIGIFSRPGECLPDEKGQIICVDYAQSLWPPLYIGIAIIIFTYIIWSILSNKNNT